MRTKIPRRKLLKATSGAGVALSLAGCLDELTGGCGSGPCCVGEELLLAIGEEDAEEAADLFPHEYLDDVDREMAVELYQSIPSRGDIQSVSCECSESKDDEEIEREGDEFSAELTDVVEVSFEVTIDNDGESETEWMYVTAVEIDGEWYAGMASAQGFNHCTPEDA